VECSSILADQGRSRRTSLQFRLISFGEKYFLSQAADIKQRLIDACIANSHARLDTIRGLHVIAPQQQQLVAASARRLRDLIQVVSVRPAAYRNTQLLLLTSMMDSVRNIYGRRYPESTPELTDAFEHFQVRVHAKGFFASISMNNPQFGSIREINRLGMNRRAMVNQIP
jgi:hypothetical protein